MRYVLVFWIINAYSGGTDLDKLTFTTLADCNTARLKLEMVSQPWGGLGGVCVKVPNL